ncbi:hypothetical protein B9Z65_4673 [Elsinoe australis]|uniref:Uncharacterized protein n=1 Tax=Elsinoe australis TaxID=40998 RepID=A0A2P8A5Q1_9PEZI|nr:hypothetical protein B9Z65_4673 [Elsinoe australis]
MATKSDLRSTSRDAHRAATQKAKWAHGIATHPVGRHASHPRPMRMSDMTIRPLKNRVSGSSSKAASARRADIASVSSEWWSLAATLSSSPGSVASQESDLDEEREAIRLVQEYEALQEVYGAEGTMPESGSQVLNGALEKAIGEYEDRETVRLVRSEWALVDDEGEEVGLSPEKGRKGRKDREELLDGEEFEMV